MPDLEMLLRDVRPVPNPDWAARLDKRAAAGFPSPPSRPKKALRGLRNHFAAWSLAAATAATLLVIVLVGIRVQNDASSDDLGSGGSSAAAPATPDSTSESAAGASSAAPLTGGSAGATVGEDRAVLKNATLTLTTAPGEVQALSDRAIRVADTLGGYVASSSVDTAGSHATAALTLKVPSAKLDTALAELSRLGHVSSRSQQTEDLTDQRAVREAALRDARADRAGLRVRLAKATTDKQRDRLRAQLDRASRRVTRAQREVARLNNTVAHATIDLTIRGKRSSGGATVPGDRWTPGDALRDAGRVLEVIAGVLVIGLAVLLPIAILAALAAYANRSLTRRRRQRALEAS